MAAEPTTTSTVERSSSSSSSFSVGIGIPAGGLASPLLSFFPSLGKHHSHAAPSSDIPAGPVWNDGDANQKCPTVCRQHNLNWTGDWRTIEANVQSTCTCTPGGYGPAANGGGSSCSAAPNYQCKGCSVSCPAGQAAHCTQGDRGIFTEPQSAICQTDAKCECK
jgi:hypothetical protein